MRKHFVAFMMAVTVAITTAFPVYAAPMTNAEAIAALHQADGRVYKNGDTANITVDLAVTNWNQTITEILNKAFPACGQPEIGPVYYEYDDGSSVRDFTISAAQLATLAEHQDVTNQWADSTAKALFSSGTDRNTVLQTAYLHIARNYPYANGISAAEVKKAQGAYYMITTGKAICASYTKAYRALIEAVLFDPVTGLVNWECAAPARIKVAIVYNDGHEWNAIQDPDGSWYHYDLATATLRDAESLQFFHMPVSKLTNGKYASFYDYDHAVWCY